MAVEHHAQVSNTAHGCSYNKYISVHIYCRSLCSGYDNNILNFRTKIRPIWIINPQNLIFTGTWMDPKVCVPPLIKERRTLITFVGWFIFKEADTKLTQAIQYNPKVGQYYITRSRCRYMMEVRVVHKFS